jgi:hypothetical protein
MRWIDASEIAKPKYGVNVLCYCPDWNDSGYQVATFKAGKFEYDEDPNGSFGDHVEKWTLFMEAD